MLALLSITMPAVTGASSPLNTVIGCSFLSIVRRNASLAKSHDVVSLRYPSPGRSTGPDLHRRESWFAHRPRQLVRKKEYSGEQYLAKPHDARPPLYVDVTHRAARSRISRTFRPAITPRIRSAVRLASSPTTEPPPGSGWRGGVYENLLALDVCRDDRAGRGFGSAAVLPVGLPGSSPVRGEISSDGAMVASSLTVELISNGSQHSDNASVNPDGTFEFRSASPGAYWLRVSAGAGSVIHEEMVNVGGPGQILSIRLNDQSSANRSAEPVRLAAPTYSQGPAPGAEGLRQGPAGGCQGRSARCRGVLPPGSRRGSGVRRCPQ